MKTINHEIVLPQVFHKCFTCIIDVVHRGIIESPDVAMYIPLLVLQECAHLDRRDKCAYTQWACVWRVWILSNHHRLSAERLLLLGLCLSPSLSPNKEVRLLKLLHSEAHIVGAKALSPYVGILPPDKSYMVPALPGTVCTYSAALKTNMTVTCSKEDRERKCCHLCLTPMYFHVIKKKPGTQCNTERDERQFRYNIG